MRPALPGSSSAQALEPDAPPASAAQAEGLHDPAFVHSLRTQMIKFAQLHLGDAHAAEDAVQEALAGAWVAQGRFAGRSALKTWVFAILKNKIADALRLRQRSVDASSLLQDDEEQSMDDFFDARGHWLSSAAPQVWDSPHDSLHQQQFWAVLEICLDGMPAGQARAFMMREFMGFETDEICATLAVNNNHFFVLMHRARLRLRECLDQRWFAAKGG